MANAIPKFLSNPITSPVDFISGPNNKSLFGNLLNGNTAVFPFNKFPNSDLLLGPEMKSTGEVMGFDKNFGMAFAKSQIAATNSLPKKV